MRHASNAAIISNRVASEKVNTSWTDTPTSNDAMYRDTSAETMRPDPAPIDAVVRPSRRTSNRILA